MADNFHDDNMPPVMRGEPRFVHTSRDGVSQIRILPVLQSDQTRSYYVVVSDGRKIAECNVSYDELVALLERIKTYGAK